MNFGLTIFAYIVVLVATLPIGAFVGFLAMLLVLGMSIFFVAGHIRCAMAGRKGRIYRIPMTLKLLK